jgi:ABC-2 type transport system permease protein
MNTVFVIVLRFLKTSLRNRGNWIFMLLLPIAFTFIFGVVPNLGNHSKTPIAVVDNDNSLLSKAVVAKLSAQPQFEVLTVKPNMTERLMRQMKVSVLISIPSGFEADALANHQLTLGWTPAPNVGASENLANTTATLQTSIRQWMSFGEPAMQGAIRSGASTDEAVSAFVGGMTSADTVHSLVTTQPQVVQTSKNKNGFDTVPAGVQSTIGFCVMFITFAVFGSTSSILEERRKWTWQRMRASPIDKGYVVAGYGLAFFVMGWVQYGILVLASRLLFGIQVPWNGVMALVVSLYVLAMCGIALCVANLVKTSEQHMGIGSFVAIGSSMIGGAYWPVDIEPSWMQHVAWFVPQSWTMKAFEQAVSGVFVNTLWLPLGVLAAFALVFYITGIVQLRYAT